jgi:hypothetical protein
MREVVADCVEIAHAFELRSLLIEKDASPVLEICIQLGTIQKGPHARRLTYLDLLARNFTATSALPPQYDPRVAMEARRPARLKWKQR